MKKPLEGTWSARANELRLQGASEDTIESVRRLTSLQRHKARVRDTIEAAHDFAETQQEATTDDHHSIRRCVIGLIAIDLIGIGGREGATGEATARLEAFQELGSGRKRAGDGSAWMAAAECALSEVCEMWKMKPVIGSGDGELVIEDTVIHVPEEWRLAVALRALSKMDAPYPTTFDDDDAGWCMVATHAQAQIRNKESAQETEPPWTPKEAQDVYNQVVIHDSSKFAANELDTIINRSVTNGLYTATSLDHPDVCGMGETEEIARQNLLKAIGMVYITEAE